MKKSKKTIFWFLGIFLLFLLILLGNQFISSEKLLASLLPDSQLNKELQEQVNQYQELSLELDNELKESENRIYILGNKIEELKQELEYYKNKDLEVKEKIVTLEEIPIEEEQEIILGFCDKDSAESPAHNKIIINEIAWMGTEISANHEWIELKNISDQDIDLTGWRLQDKDNQIKIIFEKGIIKSKDFWLLERMDDKSLPDISADLIYSGILNNSEEALYLFDNNCLIQDKVIADPEWPAGDNDSKRTMERTSDLGWQTSKNSGGTPKSENSEGYIIPPIDNNNKGGSAPQESYPEILISEIQTYPINERFIELYNPNTTDIDLTDWYIQRKTENSESWSTCIPSSNFDGKAIPAKGYFLIVRDEDLSEPDIVIENLVLTENNAIVLKNPNREEVNIVGWGENAPDYETMPFPENVEENESLGRIWDKEEEKYKNNKNNAIDFEKQMPTPKEQNTSLPNPINPGNLEKQQLLDTVINITEEINIYEQEYENNLLLNEFFEEWDEPGDNAEDLHYWDYNGTITHITRNEDYLVGNYSVLWTPITSAQNLTQTEINITDPGDYYAEIWIKLLDVDDENYIRISLDMANPINGDFPSASFVDYKIENGWIKITKNFNDIETGEHGGIRIRAQRSGSAGPSFLVGAAWLSTTPPPLHWLDN